MSVVMVVPLCVFNANFSRGRFLAWHHARAAPLAGVGREAVCVAVSHDTAVRLSFAPRILAATDPPSAMPNRSISFVAITAARSRALFADSKARSRRIVLTSASVMPTLSMLCCFGVIFWPFANFARPNAVLRPRPCVGRSIVIETR